MSVDFVHDTLFEPIQLLFRERVRFGDDGDDVDFVMQRLHKGHVERFQSVSRRGDKVEATMDTIVPNVSSIEAGFVFEVFLKLVVDVGYDGLEAAVVVDGVSVAGSVHDREAETNAALFDLNLRERRENEGDTVVIKERKKERE